MVTKEQVDKLKELATALSDDRDEADRLAGVSEEKDAAELSAKHEAENAQAEEEAGVQKVTDDFAALHDFIDSLAVG